MRILENCTNTHTYIYKCGGYGKQFVAGFEICRINKISDFVDKKSHAAQKNANMSKICRN